MKYFKIILISLLITPLIIFLITYIQFPSITMDERIMYFQVTYYYPILDYFGLFKGYELNEL